MASLFCCGFECGQLGAIGQHWNLAAGSVAISTSTVRTGARSLRINPSAAASHATIVTSSTTVSVFRVYIRFATLPGANSFVCGNAFGNIVFKSSDATFVAHANFTTQGTGAAVTITTGVWYRLDVRIVYSSPNIVIDFQVDGVAAPQFTNNPGSAQSSTINRLGTTSAATYDAFYDDYICSTTSGDYPFGAGKVEHFVPTSDGTHNVAGANDFERSNTGTDIINSTTTAYQLIDDVPLKSGTPTEYINLIAPPNATDYVECIFGPAPGISVPSIAPRGVDVICAHAAATTGANNIRVALNDNGTVDDVANGSYHAASAAIIYHSKHYSDPPSAATSWTIVAGNGNFNNIRMRCYTNDAAPDPWLASIMIEAEFPEGPLLKELSDSVTITDANAKSEIITKTDSSTITDLASNRPTLIKSDSITSTDNKIINSVLNKSDSVTINDLATKTYFAIRELADSVTIADLSSFSSLKFLSDSVTISDNLVALRILIKELADSVGISDDKSFTISLNKSDLITISDLASLSMIFNKTINDTIVLSDSISKIFGVSKSDSVSITDSIIKGFVIDKSDSVSVSDLVSNVVSKILSDSISVSDTSLRSIILNKSDSVTISDSLSKYIAKVLADIATIADNINTQLSGGANNYNLDLSDSVSLVDLITKSISKVNIDSVSLVDLVSKSTGKIITDTILVSDLVLTVKDFVLNLTDSVEIADLFANITANNYLLNLSDSVTIEDAFNTFKRVEIALQGQIATRIVLESLLSRANGVSNISRVINLKSNIDKFIP
jgi:hypothetical protein